MKNAIKGSIELYNDAVILRMPPNYIEFVTVTAPPPTFPIEGLPERIAFSEIRAVTVKPIKGFLSMRVKVEIQVASNDTWTIRTKGKIWKSFMNTYETWKNGQK